MTPTNRLRFVVRPDYPVDPEWNGHGVDGVSTTRILRQWWEDRIVTIGISVEIIGEWRDVPVEVEE